MKVSFSCCNLIGIYEELEEDLKIKEYFSTADLNSTFRKKKYFQYRISFSNTFGEFWFKSKKIAVFQVQSLISWPGYSVALLQFYQ